MGDETAKTHGTMLQRPAALLIQYSKMTMWLQTVGQAGAGLASLDPWVKCSKDRCGKRMIGTFSVLRSTSTTVREADSISMLPEVTLAMMHFTFMLRVWTSARHRESSLQVGQQYIFSKIHGRLACPG